MGNNENHIAIFTGHFGSGKTEMAINYSIDSIQKGKSTVLVDLDIVNPFFRTAEMKKELENMNIEVITPNFASTTMDIPSLSPRIYSVFERKDTQVVFDVGGDEDGATALGRFYPQFSKHTYKMFFVVNTYRPFTSNVEDIVSMAKSIERKSRLNITDLVHNTNLSYETKVEHILYGQEILNEASKALGVPISFIGVQRQLMGQLPKDLKHLAFPIDIYMKPPWRQ